MTLRKSKKLLPVGVISALLILVLLTVCANAEPFLVCDPPSAEQQVSEYEIFKDGVSMGTAAPEATGEYGFKFDLSATPPGQYEFTATAINEWGSSELSDPYISPVAAEKPSSVRLE